MSDDAVIVDLKRQIADLVRRIDKLETQGSAGQTANNTASVSSGTGTVKMNGTTSRNSTGWTLWHDQSGAAFYIPSWTTITG